jgi:hypothetical protein
MWAMKIDIVIGETEQHQMEFSFNRLSGDLIVLMDGLPVLQDSATLATGPVKSYELSVGDCEKHTLAFQLMYGDDPYETSIEAIARPRLMVTAIT